MAIHQEELHSTQDPDGAVRHANGRQEHTVGLHLLFFICVPSKPQVCP